MVDNRGMLRFVRRGVVVPAVAALVVTPLMAGCGAGSSGAEPEQPPPAPAPSTPPTSVNLVIPPSVASPAPRAPAPGLRPMTTWERQQKDKCERQVIRNGCDFYNDKSLRLQGVDPEATTPGG